MTTNTEIRELLLEVQHNQIMMDGRLTNIENRIDDLEAILHDLERRLEDMTDG